MAAIAIIKGWGDGDVLLESDLDAIKTGVETFINVTKINDDNIQDSGITASSKLLDSSISTAKIAASAITSAKIADDAVTTAKIIDDAVTTAKVLDANITKAKLATGAKNRAVTNKTTTYTATTSDEVITCDTSGGGFTLTLPAASGSTGQELFIVKTSASNTLTLDGNASELINGSATYPMYLLNEAVKIVCNGSQWFIVDHYLPRVQSQNADTQTDITSTSYAGIGGLSLRTTGRPVLLTAHVIAENRTAGVTHTFSFFVNSGQAGPEFKHTAYSGAGSGYVYTMSMSAITTPAAGTNTFEISGKTSSGSAGIVNINYIITVSEIHD